MYRKIGTDMAPYTAFITGIAADSIYRISEEIFRKTAAKDLEAAKQRELDAISVPNESGISEFKYFW